MTAARHDREALVPLPTLHAVSSAASLVLLNLSLMVAVGMLAFGALGREAVSAGVGAAVIASVVGGMLVAALARSSAEVSAPASSIAVIYAAVAVDAVARAGGEVTPTVWSSLALTVVQMGALLWLAGRLRLAHAVKFLPSPVSAGFITGIGLLVVWAQVPVLLGLEGRLAGHAWPAILAEVKPASILVAGVAALVTWLWPRFGWRGQPSLIALAIAASLHHLLAWAWGGEHLGPVIGNVDPVGTAAATLSASWSGLAPLDLARTALHVFPYAAFLALQALMNAALTSASVANILGHAPDVNRTLRAQGIANLVCGALGVLPVTTSAPQSLAAARQKAGPPVLVASCVLLLVMAVAFGQVLAKLPTAALAGILLVTGLRLVDPWVLDLTRRAWRSRGRESEVLLNLVLVLAVAAAFFVGSVPMAVLVGASLAMILLAVSVSRATTFMVRDGRSLASARIWPSEQAALLASHRDSIALLRSRGELFFGTADQLERQLSRLPEQVRYCVLDLSKTTTIDATACRLLARTARRLEARGVHLLLAGLEPGSQREATLRALGMDCPEPDSRWFSDADHALEWAESEVLSTRWPTDLEPQAEEAAVTALTRGLDAGDTARLLAQMKERSVECGTLFRRGDPGASLFLVRSGRVEIQITHPETARTTRLASFGPGSMFGEIALLTSDTRSAEVVCVEPGVLLELDRAAFDRLETDHPQLHDRVLRNIALHLANRLLIANGAVAEQ